VASEKTLLKISVSLVFLALIPATSAESFGDPVNQAVPNVTEIQIYDVTGLSQQDQRTQGKLVDQGLNKTFSITQRDYHRYRFEFLIQNDGSGDWNISSEDEMKHSGLETSWNVEEIFYNVSTARFGGNFTSGTVNWNTSDGEILEETGENSSMTASYIANISVPSSQSLNQDFLVNDTSNNSGSRDSHVLDLTRAGILNVSVTRPPNDTVLQRNDSFNVTGQAECLDGECGEAGFSTRYNQTGDSAGTIISENSGMPFHTIGKNLETCSGYLATGETCRKNITVNATGDVGSEHLLDVNSSSNITEVEDNDSEDKLVTVKSVIILDLSWDTVSFGAIDPGRQDIVAEGNANSSYNITVTENSRKVDNLWVNASNLTSEVDPDYAIRPWNITQGFTKDSSEGTQLNYSFQKVMSDISPGTVVPTYYHLDVPFGLTEGDYSGSITFKANTTT